MHWCSAPASNSDQHKIKIHLNLILYAMKMKLIISTSRFKQCFALIATAYLAFALFFTGNGSGRSLQQGEENFSSVAAANGESNHHHTKKDILVIVMGQKKTFPVWVNKFGPIDASLTLLYGSYDDSISVNPFPENNYDLTSQIAFIPETTWTEARNLLASEAVRMEVRRGKQFDYWIFLDDDVDVVCAPDGGGEEMEEMLGEGSCWQKAFNFIGSDLVPENASGVYLGGQNGFAARTNTDAMFAAFKRSHVPYLLPYATLPAGSSEWTSQAALYCIVQTCMRSSVVMIPYVGGENKRHRPYARGMNKPEIVRVIADNYHDKAADFLPCTQEIDIRGRLGFVGVFDTKEELNDHIPPTEFEMCSPMKSRYEKWERDIIDLLAEKEGARPLPSFK